MRTATLHSRSTPLPQVRRAPASVVYDALSRLVETLFLWQQRTQQRRQLARFDDRMLRDIGISRTDAAREVEKLFWQA